MGIMNRTDERRIGIVPLWLLLGLGAALNAGVAAGESYLALGPTVQGLLLARGGRMVHIQAHRRTDRRFGLEQQGVHDLSGPLALSGVRDRGPGRSRPSTAARGSCDHRHGRERFRGHGHRQGAHPRRRTVHLEPATMAPRLCPLPGALTLKDCTCDLARLPQVLKDVWAERQELVARQRGGRGFGSLTAASAGDGQACNLKPRPTQPVGLLETCPPVAPLRPLTPSD